MDITKDGYSTVDPYPLMYERCESQAPLYNRTKGCWFYWRSKMMKGTNILLN